MKDNWYDRLRNRMEDYEQSAPDGLWEDIEASLPKKKAIGPLGWVWRTAAIAAALAIGIFATLRLTNHNEAPSNVIAVQAPTVEPNGEPERLAVAEPANEAHPAMSASKPASRKAIPEQKSAAAAAPVTAEATEYAGEVQSEEKIEESSEQLKTEDESTEDMEEAEKTAEFLRQAAAEDMAHARTRKPISTRFSVGAGATESSSSGVFNISRYDSGPSPIMPDGEINLATRSTTDETPTKNIYDDVTHKRPIRMGLLLNIPFSRVFGIETGVTYSILNSTFTTTSGGNVIEDDQKLQYIGIPLNVTANILQTRYLSLYATAGGMGEKCISGKVKTNINGKNSEKAKSTTRNLDINEIMWSANAAAGMQFNITDFMGIYAEPGISYHFDNNSKTTSAYTEHPLDFTMNFGIRFSLGNSR